MKKEVNGEASSSPVPQSGEVSQYNCPIRPLEDNLSTLENMRAEAVQAGGSKRIADQHARGKLTARERLDLLLDENSFEEFDVLKAGRGGHLGGQKEGL